MRQHILTVALITAALFILSCYNKLSALDSPLVIRSSMGDLTAAINPNTGTIQLYRTGGGLQLTLVGSHYYLADLELWSNKEIPSENVSWSYLRAGMNTRPVYYDRKTSVIHLLDGKAGTLVMDTEDEFWKEVPEYDGVVAAAIGVTHLFLCIPSTHTLLAYKITNGSRIELVAVRNIGPDLMIPGAYNSKPSPAQLLEQLPKEVREARKEAMEKIATDIEDGNIPPLSDPEPWMHALQGDKIVIVEPANQKILTYEIAQKGLNLKSARSMEIELLVPPGVSVNSNPSPALQYKNYVKMMRKSKITPYTLKELTALADVNANHNAKNTGEDIQASVDERFNLLLNFTTTRKLILYRPDSGGAGIEMKSVRDYTMEIATALHVDKINKERSADELFKIAKDNLTKKKRPKAMRLLKIALVYKPALYEDLEKNKKMVRSLSEEPGWSEMLDSARKAYEKEQADIKLREEKLKEQEAN
ncbi:MAG: hypothetical protein HRU15_08830 [Planctomycetes bacterium]|nr:hypothetical protein [Planctomycetota bacterium]